MKQTTKNVGKFFAVAMLSAAVAGVTTYALMPDERVEMTSFVEQFPQSARVMPTVFGSSSAGAMDLTKAAEASVNAVVHIKSTQLGKVQTVQQPMDLFDFFFGNPQGGRQRQVQTQPRVGFGSGVIISADGYIVTNNHVIEGADEISVKLNDSREFVGRIIGTDPNTDLALVKIEAEDELPTIPVGDSDALKVGEWVLAVGNPFNLNSTVTAGIVSAKARSLGVYNNGIESFIQTDAVINRGNSGGALVNSNGELIGINSAIASPSGYYAGYGFAIPVNLVKKIADDFKQFGEVKRGFVGITFTELNPEVAKELKVAEYNGLYVQSVVGAGGADKAGIKEGDIVTHINGRLITSSSVLQEGVGRLRPGDKVELTYLRDGKERKTSVTLQEAKSDESSADTASKSSTQLLNDLGAGFKSLTPAQKKEMGINAGLVISEVRKGGLFERYGVPRGMIVTTVNDIAVNSVEDIEKALNKSTSMIYMRGFSPDGARVELAFPAK